MDKITLLKIMGNYINDSIEESIFKNGIFYYNCIGMNQVSNLFENLERYMDSKEEESEEGEEEDTEYYYKRVVRKIKEWETRRKSYARILIMWDGIEDIIISEEELFVATIEKFLDECKGISIVVATC